MITIDLGSPVPLTDQVVAGIRRAIAERRATPGDELPTVRQLAVDLGVNFNTVARAYRALEACGLVQASRGRGSRIVADVEKQAAQGRERATSSLEAAFADLRLADFRRPEVEAIVAAQIEALWGSGY